MGKILIKNGRVWDGESFFFADLLTDGRLISKIRDNISDSADFVFDARGMIVSAGLVDAHTHLRGVSTDNFGINAEAVCFPFGVTAAADAAAELGNSDTLNQIGVKTCVYVATNIRDNKAYFENTLKYLEAFGESTVGVKVYFDETGGQVRDITPLKEICNFAHGRGLKVMVHCSDSPTDMSEILDCLTCGDTLTHAFHGEPNTSAEGGFKALKEAQKRGVIIDVGFAGHVHTDFSVLEAAIKNDVVPDIISTDITRFSAFRRGGRYGLTMCMSIAKDLGLLEEDVFCAVTSGPAKALAKENEWGSLREGGTADICLLYYTDEPYCLTDKSGNTVKNTKGYRCVLTISDGEVVYRR